MDKVLSTRLDERILAQLEEATRRLRISKKQFLEEAIELRAGEIARSDFADVLASSAGAWADRPGTTEQIIEEGRESSRGALHQHWDEAAKPDVSERA